MILKIHYILYIIISIFKIIILILKLLIIFITRLLSDSHIFIVLNYKLLYYLLLSNVGRINYMAFSYTCKSYCKSHVLLTNII